MANIEHITVGDTTYDIKDSQILTNLIDNVGTGSVRHVEAVSSSNPYAFAEGNGTTAVGRYSHAEGYNTTASGDYSHAEGCSTTASGYYSHAEGWNTTALAAYSHAEGYNTVASVEAAHAEGYYAVAPNYYSSSYGSGTLSTDYQTAIGTYNATSASLFVLGNGTASNSRSNAFEIDGSYTNNSSQKIGYRFTKSRTSDISTTSGTAKAVLTVTELTAGIWLVAYGVRFEGDNKGVRRMNFVNTSGSSDINYQLYNAGNSITQLQATKFITVSTDNEPWYLNAYQTSGSSLNVLSASTTTSQAITYVAAIKISA